MEHKYISTKVRETKDRLIQALNESDLPRCVLQMIVADIEVAVSQLAEQEYQEDLEAEQSEPDP